MLGFNVPSVPGEGVQVFAFPIIYQIIETYQNWKSTEERKQEEHRLDQLVRPCKIQVLPGCLFRQSNPAVVGIRVLGGLLKTGVPLMKRDGTPLTTVKSIQQEKESLSEAAVGKEVAISLPNVTVGRQVHEQDLYWSDIPEADFHKLKNAKKSLQPNEIAVLKEIAEIKRRENPIWGI